MNAQDTNTNTTIDSTNNRDINFEGPYDINFEEPYNINLEEPKEESQEISINVIANNQIRIIKMLHQLLNKFNNTGEADYLTLKQACEKYKLTDRTIHNQMALFTRVKSRSLDYIVVNDLKMYNEDDIREAILQREYITSRN